MKSPFNPFPICKAPSTADFETSVKCLIILLIGNLLPHALHAQVINAYAEVTNISGATVTIGIVDETGDTFEDGEQVIIMQMQDDVIGANTGDNSNFGKLGTIQSAGLYEITTITSHIEAGGVPTSFTLNASLKNSYNTGANSSIQIISFPRFGDPDYTLSGASALSWNGSIGGVIALQVDGELTLAGDINADSDGFRGASANGGGAAGCSGNVNYRLAMSNNFANKGEGIYKSTNSGYAAGQARILTGGGGGNSHNGGGGGGGNYSAGGAGGPGWPNCSPTAGGTGGIDLSGEIVPGRIFMGGGGGAGEGNNGGSRDAGNGGGIILINAMEVRTEGTCSGITISADGASVALGSGGDGNSGGGAGGTVLFEVKTWDVASGCPVTVRANGGDGGDVTHQHIHGAGGGGGQGAVIYSISEPSANTTTFTDPGEGGSNCYTCGNAGVGEGLAGAGIIDNTSGPLPISLINFQAMTNSNGEVEVIWQTASEINNDFFTIERSQNTVDWEVVTYIAGAGNSQEVLTYEEVDPNPHQGLSYYRLKQTDFDGRFEYFAWEPVTLETKVEAEIWMYPNPTNALVHIFSGSDLEGEFSVYNTMGTDITARVATQNISDNHRTIDLSTVPPGFYVIVSEGHSQMINKL